MANPISRSNTSRNHDNLPSTRSWAVALFWALVIVGVSVVASATINPLFGRAVHWDWMAGVAPTGFVLVALALRRRWV